MNSQIRSKTWKRELGVLFAAILVYTIYQDNTAMAEVIVWPIMSFIAASAGLHIYDKSQITVSGRIDPK